MRSCVKLIMLLLGRKVLSTVVIVIGKAGGAVRTTVGAMVRVEADGEIVNKTKANRINPASRVNKVVAVMSAAAIRGDGEAIGKAVSAAADRTQTDVAGGTVSESATAIVMAVDDTVRVVETAATVIGGRTKLVRVVRRIRRRTVVVEILTRIEVIIEGANGILVDGEIENGRERR